MKKKLIIGLTVAVIVSFSLMTVSFAAGTNYVVYDTSVWTEFGYTVQRYIGAAFNVGIRIFAIIFGIDLVIHLINWLAGIFR